MTWAALSTEVQLMFDAFAWRAEEHQMTLESYAARVSAARKEQADRARIAWRQRNPAKYRAAHNNNRWRTNKRRKQRMARIGAKGGRTKAVNAMLAAKTEIRRRAEARRAA